MAPMPGPSSFNSDPAAANGGARVRRGACGAETDRLLGPPGPRSILHVDMDAFYAAVEQRDRPELQGRPVVVGADPRGGRGRGVVATASYEARRFGVASAMPISEAWRRCPQAAYLPPDMDRYASVAREVREIFGRFTDLVEPISIDEAFLDVTASRRALGEAEVIARAVKGTIRGELRLTASVGLATSKLVAKIASDMRKPDGLVVVPPGGEAAFLAPLPVRRLWGVGPKMEEQLVRLGIQTIGDLAALGPERLERRLGAHGHDLLRLARGEDEREVVGDAGDAKSVGHEHTFDTDTADLRRLRRTLLGLADAVARRLRQHAYRGRTITLKYRDETFHTVTRAETIETPTDSGEVLFAVAWRLFQRAHGSRRVRLLGISASGFQHREQLGLFHGPPRRADRVLDAVDERFGEGTLTRASRLRPAGAGEPGEDAPRDRKGSRRLLR
jgi:DNA polymerase IV